MYIDGPRPAFRGRLPPRVPIVGNAKFATSSVGKSVPGSRQCDRIDVACIDRPVSRDVVQVAVVAGAKVEWVRAAVAKIGE